MSTRKGAQCSPKKQIHKKGRDKHRQKKLKHKNYVKLDCDGIN